MSLRDQGLRGFLWTTAEQFGNRIIQFIISIILARLIAPEQYGLIGVLAIFNTVGGILADSGMTTSLIRKKDTTYVDFSTVFFINVTISVVIYGLIVGSSPFIAKFYNEPILSKIIIVYSLPIIINSFSAVQSALLVKKLSFKTLFKVKLPSTIISGVAAIVMAKLGFKVWALVYMYLIQSSLYTLQIWFYSDWRPKRVFDIELFKEHLNYGYKLSLSSILNNVVNDSYGMLIGKQYSIYEVGIYQKAYSLQKLPVTTLNKALNQVTFPLLSKIQDDDGRLRKSLRKIIGINLLVISFFMLLANLIAEPLFIMLLTEKWVGAVPYFKLLCLAGFLFPIEVGNSSILKIKDRTSRFLTLTIVTRVLYLSGLIVTLHIGVYQIVLAFVIISYINTFINMHFCGKIINFKATQQFMHYLKILIPNLVVYILTIFLFKTVINLSGFSNLIQIITISSTFLTLFLVTQLHLNLPEFQFIKTQVNRLFFQLKSRL